MAYILTLYIGSLIKYSVQAEGTRRTITTEMDTEVENISVGWGSQFWKVFMMNFAS